MTTWTALLPIEGIVFPRRSRCRAIDRHFSAIQESGEYNHHLQTCGLLRESKLTKTLRSFLLLFHSTGRIRVCEPNHVCSHSEYFVDKRHFGLVRVSVQSRDFVHADGIPANSQLRLRWVARWIALLHGRRAPPIAGNVDFWQWQCLQRLFWSFHVWQCAFVRRKPLWTSPQHARRSLDLWQRVCI